MANKAFEIQNSTLRIGGVDLQAGNNSIVIPGVTQAVNYFVEEIDDQDGNNPDTFGSNPNAVTVIDNAEYLYRSGIETASGSYSAAIYSVDELDDGEIDEINIDAAGTFLDSDNLLALAANMWATTVADPYTNFNTNDWTQIPFRPKMRAGQVDNVGGSGGLTVITPEDFEVQDVTTLAFTGAGVTVNKVDDVTTVDIPGGSADLGDFTINNSTLSADSITIQTDDGDITLESDSDVFANIRNNGEFTISDRDGETFKFEPTLGKLTFPDGTEQTTAYTGGNANTGNVVFDGNQMYVGGTGFLNLETDTGVAVIGTNGPQPLLVSINESDKIWTFDPDGWLSFPGTFPGGAIGYDSDTQTLQLARTSGVSLYTQAGAWVFGSDGSITFPDDTVQTTAYTGGSGGSSTVVRQDTPPSASNGTLWFNTVEGRLYIKYVDQWIDASPVIIPPPQTELDVNSITFADASVQTTAWPGTTTVDRLVNGSKEVVLNSDGSLLVSDDIILPNSGRLIKDCGGDGGKSSMRWVNIPTNQEIQLFRAYTGTIGNLDNTERAKISLEWQNPTVSGLSITSFDRTDGATEHKWNFLGDGSLKFPGQPDYRIVESEPGLVVTSEIGFAVVTNSVESAKNWLFGTDGVLTLPAGGDIEYSNGVSVITPQGEYVHEFTGLNTELTLVNITFNLLYCKQATGYSGSDPHNVNLSAGRPGQRLVVINSSNLNALAINNVWAITSGTPAEFIYSVADGEWAPLYGATFIP